MNTKNLIGTIIVFLLQSTTVYSEGKFSYTDDVFIENIRIIDGKGSEPVEGQDVFVSDGKIVKISAHGQFKVPKDIKRLKGGGLTLMPGLMDTHVHLLNKKVNWRKGLDALLYSGVTTIHDMGGVLDDEIDIRSLLAKDGSAAPGISFSGRLFNGESDRMGPFTQAQTIEGDSAILTLRRNADVIAALDQHQAAGVKLLKAYTMLPRQRLEHLTTEAHKRGMRVVVDASRAMGTLVMNRTGVDGYAHPPWHFKTTQEEISDLKERGIWFVCTVGIIDMIVGMDYPLLENPDYAVKEPLINQFFSQEVIRSGITPASYENFGSMFEKSWRRGYGERFSENAKEWGRLAQRNTKFLMDSGILIGMGTDSGADNVLLPAGWSMHHEMDVWVNRIGISPLETIQAATYNNARILQIENRTGSVTEGLDADLLIVAGNPATNIKDSRNIKYVFLGGKIVDRFSLSYQ